MKPIYLIFGAIAAYTVYSLSKLAKNLSYAIEGISVGGNLFKPIINLTIKVSNPTNQSATLLSMTGDIYINGQELSSFQNFTSTFISANTSTLLKIEAKPHLFGSIAIAKYFIQNKGRGIINVEVKGIVNVDGNTFNFNNKIKV